MTHNPQGPLTLADELAPADLLSDERAEGRVSVVLTQPDVDRRLEPKLQDGARTLTPAGQGAGLRPKLQGWHRPRPAAPAKTCFDLRFEAECHVLSLGHEEFEAEVHDLDFSKDERSVEVAVFDIEEVSPPDRPLLVPGAIFYWTIGYERDVATGRVRGVSQLRFKRPVKPSRRDREHVRRRVDELGELFGLPD